MIEFKNVSKTYDNGTEALKDVNIKINDGEFVFVVGSSGAGKSTFLKIMMREQVPNSGSVIINGYHLNNLKKKEIPLFRRTLGIVFQDFRLIPTMTVFDNVAFAMRCIGAKEKEVRKRVPYILSLVGLASKARNLPTELSGGEQQRAALAKVLLMQPRVLLLDEPTKGMDGAFKAEFGALLRTLCAQGTAVCIVSHDVEFCAQYADRCGLLFRGEVVTENDPRAFFSGNYFYTTAAARIARTAAPGAVLCEEVVQCLAD